MSRDPVQNFYHWLSTASPGAVCVYHRGLLMADRQWWFDSGNKSFGHWGRDEKVDNLAKAVWTAYRLGDVYLLQRKLGEGDYEYLAIRSRKEIVA